jgi:AAA15 family ATPase/GTPase
MLIEFNVSNFRSIKEKQTLSLIAAPISSRDKIDETNVFVAPDGAKLLKSVAIYGANGSGKSNLIRALMRMMQFIEKAFEDGDAVKLFEPFALDADYEREPSQFEVVFYTGQKRYRYGFEISKDKVSAEWLFGLARKNEVEYFTRLGEKVKVNKASFKEGAGLVAANLRDSALALNIVHDLGGPVAKEIKDFFRGNIIITLGINDKNFQTISRGMLTDNALGERILQLLRTADTGIMEVRNVDMDKLIVVQQDGSEDKTNLQEGEKKNFLMSVRQIKNAGKANETRVFFFNQFESEGTKRLFAYAGPIVESLLNGMAFVVDEFDARLHPNLTRKIVELYNSKEFNPKNAQLIFVTHDVNLLDPMLLRRDQIYFAEKNNAGETSLYSLVNIKGVRNDASYEKDYIKGKYGAIPYLGNFNRLVK